MATYYKLSSSGRCPLVAGDILINTSTFKPAHCGIVVTHDQVIHATNDGIKTNFTHEWGSQADVFRANPGLTTAEATAVVAIATEIKDSASYGKNRAVWKSTFGSGSFGNGAMARLNKYRERLKDHQGVIKNVYCSELVILSYQLAWIDKVADIVTTHHRLFISFDGSRTWPSTLRRFLSTNLNWSNLGTLDP
jgi:hypothetical protein